MNNGYTYDEQFDTSDSTCDDCDKSYSLCDCDQQCGTSASIEFVFDVALVIIISVALVIVSMMALVIDECSLVNA